MNSKTIEPHGIVTTRLLEQLSEALEPFGVLVTGELHGSNPSLIRSLTFSTIVAEPDAWQEEPDGASLAVCWPGYEPDGPWRPTYSVNHQSVMWRRPIRSVSTRDPVLRAFRDAPVGPPLSKDERSVVEESERCLAAGERGKTADEIDGIVAGMRPIDFLRSETGRRAFNSHPSPDPFDTHAFVAAEEAHLAAVKTRESPK